MKSIKNITLLAMLMVLGACSTVQETSSKEELAFFDLIKGKSVFLKIDNSKFGEFSSNGKKFIVETDKGDANVPFVNLSGNTAEYSLYLAAYTFTTTDGISGHVITKLLDMSVLRQNITLK